MAHAHEETRRRIPQSVTAEHAIAPSSVMAALVAAIYVFLWIAKEDVDARHKAGHDEDRWWRLRAGRDSCGGHLLRPSS